MANPRQLHNGTDIPKGPGDGATQTGGEGEETGTGGEGGEGKESATNENPRYPAEELANTGKAMQQERERRRSQRRRCQRRKKRRNRKGTGTEIHHMGARSRSLAWGGGVTPLQRKMRTSQDSTQNMRTCFCRESMETSPIITTGHTWTGE